MAIAMRSPVAAPMRSTTSSASPNRPSCTSSSSRGWAHEAVLDRDDLVALGPPQPGHAVDHGQAQRGAEAPRRERRTGGDDRVVDAPEAPQGVGDEVDLGPHLGAGLEGLEVAAAAAVGHVRAAGPDAVGRGPQPAPHDAPEGPLAVDQLDLDLLTREGARHQHDPTVGMAGQGVAAGDETIGHEGHGLTSCRARCGARGSRSRGAWSASDGGRSVTSATVGGYRPNALSLVREGSHVADRAPLRRDRPLRAPRRLRPPRRRRASTSRRPASTASSGTSWTATSCPTSPSAPTSSPPAARSSRSPSRPT